MADMLKFRRSNLAGRLRGWSVVVLAAALGGCGAAQPFVHDDAAYNREHPDFAKTPKRMESVTICYSKYGTQPAAVAKLAADACGRYGAGIRFAGNTYARCPMLTPVGANFQCVGAKGEVIARDGRTARRGGYTGTYAGTYDASTPGQPGAPLAGFDEGARPMGLLFGRPAATPAAGPAPSAPPAVPTQPETPK